MRLYFCLLTKGFGSWYFLWILHSDKEVIQEEFKLEPSSGVITQDSMRAVCTIRMPDGDLEAQTTARVSNAIFPAQFPHLPFC